MPNTDSVLDAVYGEGWDLVGRAPAGVMPEDAARDRDQAGAQYAVLLRAGGRPVALIHVAWAAGYLGVHEFDEEARRVREYGFRVLEEPGGPGGAAHRGAVRGRYPAAWRTRGLPRRGDRRRGRAP